ncbi:hypothetical protein KJ673_03480 [Patescibacteria group bacterium]|nr:hypothetical protein [Patescibacteria group bacterium]MBU4453156.1 hypothetical protein [Patescibacteria group bacterium]
MNNKKNQMSPRSFNHLIAALSAAEASLEANPWGESDETQAAHKVARGELHDARESLSTAIRLAPWGRNGCVFISDRGDGIGSRSRERGLHINGRLRAVVRYEYGETGGWVDVISTVKAEEEYRARRESARAWDTSYKALLEEVALALLEAGIIQIDNCYELIVDGWRYEYGQMGGCFRKDMHPGVSAPGALSRARKILEASMRQQCRFDSPFAGLKLG